MAYAQEEGKGLIKSLSDKKKKQVGAPQVKAVGSHGMCPIGRQEGSRKVWGVRPKEQGSCQGPLQTAEFGSRQTPHSGTTAQSHKGGKGQDQTRLLKEVLFLTALKCLCVL